MSDKDVPAKKRDITTLRDHLFDTLELAKQNKLSVDHLKSVAELGQVIINTAKLEVEYAKATKQKIPSGFIPDLPTALPPGEPE